MSLHSMEFADAQTAFARLLNIMEDLRENCPWDKKQTLQSLRILTIEEVYELSEAIIAEDMNEIKEEIGDILLHLVFYSKIASETEKFDITEAIHTVCEKLIQRHPHIYGDVKASTEEEVKKNWETIKLQSGKKSVLSGVPSGLPSMVKAYRMQEKTAQFGFQWKDRAGVWDKLKEEMQELEDAIDSGNTKDVEMEFGDVLFSLINYGRYLKIDPEAALEKVNKKFKKRFEYIENHSHLPLADMTLDDMEVLWQEAKTKA
ncbi:MAG: nucleoside triphosphate pyrophosphohydrolase [Saprospiraceae bacterium]